MPARDGARNMSSEKPDFKLGVRLATIPEGRGLLGTVGEEEVLLVRRGAQLFAVGARCTHYHGPLAEGLVIGDEVRCPWHHACFSLRTGEALRAPAFDPVPCYHVADIDGVVKVGAKKEVPARAPASGGPERIVIVGAGAAGHAA